MKKISIMLLFLLTSGVVWAGEADVVDVRVENRGDRIFTFFVTLRHDDQGWDHYANKWEIVAPDGRLLGTRVLVHPHVEEQPFTRSLGGIKIEPDIQQVTIRAHDSVHGYGGKTMIVELPET